MRSGGTEIKDCRIENCAQCGILIKGGTKSYNLQVDNCYFASCLHGIFFEMGKIEARIVSTTIIDQGKYGVHVNPSVMGSVALNSCNISNCGVLELVNVSQAQYSVTVDGVLLRATQIEVTACAPLLPRSRADGHYVRAVRFDRSIREVQEVW